MTIMVKAYATLVHYLSSSLPEIFPSGTKAGTPVPVNINDGASTDDLITELDLQNKKPLLLFRNGKALKPSDRLQPGDEISIFPPVGGGR